MATRRSRRLSIGAAVACTIAVLSGGFYLIRVAQHAESAATKSENAAELARAEVITSREQAYAGRAQVCRTQILLGARPTGVCLDPHVLAYYDPSEQRVTPTFSCALWRGLHLPDIPADCEGR